MSKTIPLSRRDGTTLAYALVDDADVPLLAGVRWYLSGGYARRKLPRDGGRQIEIPMHRFLFGLAHNDGLEVDHINRNKLDNRRANLRIATRAQNNQNVPARGGSSRFRGVTFHRKTGKWAAQVKISRRNHHVGLFETEAAAASAAAAFRAVHMPFSSDAVAA